MGLIIGQDSIQIDYLPQESVLVVIRSIVYYIGIVAEWLGKALQKLVHQFESD
jgi:hypothetical protein